MGRMKTTPVGGRQNTGGHEREQESSPTDVVLSYEKKGKRKQPPLSPADATKKAILSAQSDDAEVATKVNAEAVSKVKGKGARKGPAPKSKTRAAPEESQHGDSDPEASDCEGSDRERASQPTKRKKVEAAATEFDEDECRRQLNLLGQAARRPPTAMTEDIFHVSCNLPRDGLNPHRLKMDKDVKKSDVEGLFGEEKGRNGFLLAERLSPALRKEVEALYCQIYQKTVCPTHVGKELAMGWTLQKQGKGINWAGFAAETNLVQRRFFARRVRQWITRLATVQNKTFEEVAQKEVLYKYLDVEDEKKPMRRLYQSAPEDIGEVSTKVPERLHSTPSVLSDNCRAERLADVQDLVNDLTTALQMFEAEAEDLQVRSDNAADQVRGSRLGIQQLTETMKEMAGEGGSDILQRLRDGHSKKMSELMATEQHLRAQLDAVTSKVFGTQSRLAALGEHLEDLKRGGDGVLLHPQPLPNHSGDVLLQEPLDIEVHRLRCSACMEWFPFGDVVLCSCKHAYHPWCAAQWFKDTNLCAQSNCGAVQQRWLQSWGFSSRNAADNPKLGHFHVQGPIKTSAPVSGIKRPPAVHILGLSSLGTGAPSLSGSGSNLSKCFANEKFSGGRSAVGGSTEDIPSTPSQGNFDGDGSSNPYDSKCSAVGALGLKQSETSSPQSMASLQVPRAVLLPLQSIVDKSEACPITILEAPPAQSCMETTEAPEVTISEACVTNSGAPPIQSIVETRDASPVTVSEAPLVQSRVETREAPSVMILDDTGDVGDFDILSFQQSSARVSELEKKLLKLKEHVTHVDGGAPHATAYRTLSTIASGTKQDECIEVPHISPEDDPWDLSEGVLGKMKGPLSGGAQSHPETTLLGKSTRPLSTEEQPHLETSASTGKDQPHSLETSAHEGATTQETAIRDCSSPRVTDTEKRTSSVKGRTRAPSTSRSPSQIMKRNLRPRIAGSVSASAGAAGMSRGSGSDSPQEGTWTPPSLDLSRGLEALPILWNERDARTLSSPLEESSTYACNPVLHESVDVAALGRACSRHMCSLCISDGRCRYNHGNICSVDTAGMAYTENGILTAPYLAEFWRSRTVRNGGLVRCGENSYCPEYRRGRCSGHISRLFIRECYGTCNCKPECHNRVVQRGVQKQLQVFYVDKSKGWGIRTLETLQRGCFLFEAGGEVVTNAELLRRGRGEKFALALDAHWQSELSEGNDILLSIDASRFSNVSRWLNHRCGDANLMDIPVLIEHHVPTLYHVAFFTNQVVQAGEELTWDYGCEFNILRGAMVPFKCTCGSNDCRASYQ